MKKRLIGLLLLLVMVCGVCLTACNGDAEDVLKSIVFENDGKAVATEFELPATVGGKNVTWTSDNEAVKLEKTADGSAYVAKITFPEDDQVKVNLTVSYKNASRTFTVKVNPLIVDDIADEYIFAKKDMIVVESFNLDGSFEYQGKKADITWSVPNDAHKDYIEVKNGQCVVYPSSLNPEVEIMATFSYKGGTADRRFKFTVSIQRSHLEEIDYWYNNTGVGRDLKGYVVAIAEAYPKYDKFISFYLLDEEKNAGYYVYRLDIGENNQDEANKIVPGVYMEISGKVNGLYNGLYETTNAGNATWTIDSSKTVNIDELIYSIDNDVLAGSPAERRHTGTLVSLTNWTVKSVASTPDTSGKTAALILTKGGKDVAVSTSKYMASFYQHTGSDFDDAGKAIANLCKTYKAGDVVSVTGILSYYDDGKTTASTNGIQILPRSVNDVKAGTADPAGTVYDGTKVGAAYDKLVAALGTEGLKGIVTADKEVTLPTAEDGATLTYKLCSVSNAVKLEGSKFTITPAKHEQVNVQVDIKHGDYTTSVFFAIESQKMTDKEIVEAEKNTLTLPSKEISKAGGTIELRANGSTFTTAAITWEIVGKVAFAEIKGGKLVVNTLPETDTTITLKATITCGAESATETFTVTVKASLYTITKADTANLSTTKAYKLVMDQNKANKTLFAVGKFNGFYLDSTQDADKASDIFVEKVDGGVKLYFKDGETKLYLGVTRSGTYSNVNIGGKVGSSNGTPEDPKAEAKTYNVWTITADSMVIKIDETTSVCLGTQKDKTFTTFSFRTGANATEAKVFPAYLAEVTAKA